LAASCTTAGGSGGVPGDPNRPQILSFVAGPNVAPAPALVAFPWAVSDPNGDTLTCRLDPDGDGDFDLVVSPCQGSRSRNWTFDVAGAHTATLEVSDGTSPPVTATFPVQITAGTAEPYDVVARSVTSLTPSQAAAFASAVDRWESVIVRGVADVGLNVAAGECLDDAAAVTGAVDDVVIDLAIRPIDGAGGVLGQAGPCVVWSGDALTRYGYMEFDVADVANLEANGIFDDVVLHEVGHVLGIGTLWDYNRALITGAGSSDPRFVGLRGVAAWSTLGGLADVPVEGGGGPGTADAHWRESTFDRELMTGYIDLAGNPLSGLSIASLADLGYQVAISQADPYSLPGGGAARATAGPEVELGEMLRPPISSI
jgi:hypothetical protein